MRDNSKRTRNQTLNLRVSSDEKEALKQKAAAAGMTVTALILTFLLSEKAGEEIGSEILKRKKK